MQQSNQKPRKNTKTKKLNYTKKNKIEKKSIYSTSIHYLNSDNDIHQNKSLGQLVARIRHHSGSAIYTLHNKYIIQDKYHCMREYGGTYFIYKI